MPPPPRPVAPLQPSRGWGVLHLFCRATPGFDADRVLAAEEQARKEGNQVVAAAMLGHKSDVGLVALGPDLWQLRAFQTEVQGAGLIPVASYVSLTELSEYAAGIPEEMKQARLFPQLPPDGKTAFCFYPMSKRRAADHNWFALDFEERKALMYRHGAVGRTFHGRILQVITGSTGLDDWEWGGYPLWRSSRRPKGLRLPDALRRSVGPLRRVRALLHRDGGRAR